MSAEMINLRLTRKRRQRLDRDRMAAQNRLAHGQSQAERERKRLAAQKAARDLDGHKRDGAPSPEPGAGGADGA